MAGMPVGEGPQQEVRDDHFPFLKLPPELRNTIYEMALVEPEPIALSDGPRGWVSKDEARVRLSGARLLRTCREIRSEALSIYFCRNRFIIGVYNNGERKIASSWLRSIGPKCRARLEQVVVEEDDWAAEMRRITQRRRVEAHMGRYVNRFMSLGVIPRMVRFKDKPDKWYRVIPLKGIDFTEGPDW